MTQDSRIPAGVVYAAVAGAVERLVEALGIVKGFDVAGHAESRVCRVLKAFVVGPLVFEGPEESFHHGVIIELWMPRVRKSEV